MPKLWFYGLKYKKLLNKIKSRFDHFNKLIFAGRLPAIPVQLADAKTFLGMCTAKVRRFPDGRSEYSDFVLKISTRLSLSADELDDLIVHEMIHYFIMYNGLPDTSPHGPIFKTLMNTVNHRYGLHITVSHHSTPEQREQAVSTRRTWHVIAVVSWRDGRTGVKVLPRVASKIIAYNNVVANHNDIAGVEYYLHDNIFWNRYPTSGAFKVHDIDADLVAPNLVGARALEIKGNKITEKHR